MSADKVFYGGIRAATLCAIAAIGACCPAWSAYHWSGGRYGQCVMTWLVCRSPSAGVSARLPAVPSAPLLGGQRGLHRLQRGTQPSSLALNNVQLNGGPHSGA